MLQEASVPTTRSNTEGHVTVHLITTGEDYKRSSQKGGDREDESNPRHREDFERLLRGMARSSE